MKILITGASGLVGRNLVVYLKNKEYELLLPTSSEINLLKYKEIDGYLKDQQPELIIHCAGKVGGIQANINEPYDYFIDNLEMGKNLILSAKRNNIKRVLNLGSSCIYPPNKDLPISEEDILTEGLEKTNEGYALAKIAIIKLCEYINKQYSDYKYKTIIPCNLYGKYDKFDSVRSHLIPAVIQKIHYAKMSQLNVVEVWGDGTVRREFMYVEDFAEIIVDCINKFDELPDTMNVGVGRDYTVNDYYLKIAEIIGYKGQFKYLLDKPVGMKRKLLNIETMRKYNLKAKTELNEGIAKTYSYFLSII